MSRKQVPTASEVSMRETNNNNNTNNNNISPKNVSNTATPLNYSTPATPITSQGNVNYSTSSSGPNFPRQGSAPNNNNSNRKPPAPHAGAHVNINNVNSNYRGNNNNNNNNDDDEADDDEEFEKEFLEVAKKNDISVKKLLKTAAAAKRSMHQRQISSTNVDNNAAGVGGGGYGTNASPTTERVPQFSATDAANNNNNNRANLQRPSGLSEHNSDSTASTTNPQQVHHQHQQQNQGGLPPKSDGRAKLLPKARVIDVDLSELIHRVGRAEDDDDDFDFEDDEDPARYYNYNYHQQRQQQQQPQQTTGESPKQDPNAAYSPYLDGDVLNRNNNDNDMSGPVLSGMSAGGVSSVATSKYNKDKEKDHENEALLGGHHHGGEQRRGGDKKKKRGVKFQSGEELEKVVFYEVDNSIYLRIEYRRPIFGWLCLLVASLAQSAQLTVETYFKNEGISPYASATWISMGQIVLISFLCAAYLGACYTGQGILGLGLFRYSVMMQVAVAGLMYTLVGVARQAVTQFSHSPRQLAATAAHPFLIAIFGLVFRNTVFYEEIAGILVFIGGVALALMPKDVELRLWGFAEVVALSNAIYTASMLFTLVKARASSVPTPILAFMCSLIAFGIQCAVAPAATSPYGDDLHYSFTGFSDKVEHWVGFFLATVFSTSALLAFIKALQFLPPITVSVAIAISPIISTFQLPILSNNPPSLSTRNLFDVYFLIGATLSVCSAIYVLYISSIKRQRVDMLMRSLSRRRKPRDPYNRPGNANNNNNNNNNQQHQDYYNQGDDGANGENGSQPVPIPASSASNVSMNHLSDSYGVGSHPYQQNQYNQRGLSPNNSLLQQQQQQQVGVSPKVQNISEGRRKDFVALNNNGNGTADGKIVAEDYDDEDEDGNDALNNHVTGLSRFSPSSSSMTKSPGINSHTKKAGLFPQSPSVGNNSTTNNNNAAAVSTIHPTSTSGSLSAENVVQSERLRSSRLSGASTSSESGGSQNLRKRDSNSSNAIDHHPSQQNHHTPSSLSSGGTSSNPRESNLSAGGGGGASNAANTATSSSSAAVVGGSTTTPGSIPSIIGSNSNLPNSGRRSGGLRKSGGGGGARMDD